jgi:hypothetical protein
LATRFRKAGSHPSGSSETTSPTPRRIQLTAVERGISNYGSRSGFPARMICSLMGSGSV